MNKEVFVYNSSDGHSRISAEIYTPKGVVRAVVQVSHGMCEYMGRYQELAQVLCGQGIVLCGNDHLGHKQTALLGGGKLGYFGGLGTRRFLVEDLELMRREMAQRYPGVPYFLLGHSMGSFAARLYALRFGGELDGLILSGTAGSNPAASGGRLLARTISQTRGDKTVSKTLYKLSLGTYAKAFPQDGPVGWLSRDRAIREAYLRDPYCTFRFTASAYHELFAMLEECNAKSWYQRFPKRLPVYLVAGDKDPVGAQGTGPREVYEKLVTAGVQDVRCSLYPDARHEVLNETCRQEVTEDLLAWLEDILAQEVVMDH